MYPFPTPQLLNAFFSISVENGAYDIILRPAYADLSMGKEEASASMNSASGLHVKMNMHSSLGTVNQEENSAIMIWIMVYNIERNVASSFVPTVKSILGLFQ